VLGPWVNPRWLNIVAAIIVGVLVDLSGTLVVTTLFSHLDSAKAAIWIGVGLIVGAILYMGWLSATRSRRPPREPHPKTTMSATERMNWRMPPLALLKPVQWSEGTKLGMGMLRAYLVVSVVLLIVKAIQLGTGTGG